MEMPQLKIFFSSVAAFVFCALLEFTFVNYMFRKPPPNELHRAKRKNLAGAENGEAGAPNKATADGEVPTEAVRTPCSYRAKPPRNRVRLPSLSQ